MCVKLSQPLSLIGYLPWTDDHAIISDVFWLPRLSAKSYLCSMANKIVLHVFFYSEHLSIHV